jgi:hypothetical protein
MLASLIAPPAAVLSWCVVSAIVVAVVDVDVVLALVLSTAFLSFVEHAAIANAAATMLHRLACLMCPLVGSG